MWCEFNKVPLRCGQLNFVFICQRPPLMFNYTHAHACTTNPGFWAVTIRIQDSKYISSTTNFWVFFFFFFFSNKRILFKVAVFFFLLLLPLKRMASFGGTTQKCLACNKTVYLVDQLQTDGKVYHKACFRCHHCKGTLKVIHSFISSYLAPINLCIISIYIYIYFASV